MLNVVEFMSIKKKKMAVTKLQYVGDSNMWVTDIAYMYMYIYM